MSLTSDAFAALSGETRDSAINVMRKPIPGTDIRSNERKKRTSAHENLLYSQCPSSGNQEDEKDFLTRTTRFYQLLLTSIYDSDLDALSSLFHCVCVCACWVKCWISVRKKQVRYVELNFDLFSVKL